MLQGPFWCVQPQDGLTSQQYIRCLLYTSEHWGLQVPQSPHNPPGPHGTETQTLLAGPGGSGVGVHPVLPSACFLGPLAWHREAASAWSSGLWMTWLFTSQTSSTLYSQGASLEIGYMTFST